MLTNRLNRLALLATLLLLTLTNSSSSSMRITKAQSTGGIAAAGTIIQYTSFNGTTYQLQAFEGRYVRYALPTTWAGANGLSGDEINRLVDQTDLVYAHMTEMIKGEPAGTGLLTIAVINLNGQDGLGLNGSKGVEISSAQLENVRQHIQAGKIPETLIHEIGHNFNLYNQYLGYYSDWSHAWTTFFITYTQYYMQEGSLALEADDLLETKAGEYGFGWDRLGTNASWERCVRDQNCQGVTANEAWAAFMLRYVRLHGQKSMSRAFEYLRDYKTSHPIPPSTAEQKNDLLIRALAEGVQTDISCEVDFRRWSASATLRSELASVFGGQLNPACRDQDGDGFSPLAGDTNDYNPLINPQATENLNNIDDDCDRIKDDLIIREQGDFPPLQLLFGRGIQLPARIKGYAEPAGEDSIIIRVTRATLVKLNLRNRGEFHGWINLRSLDSIGGGGSNLAFYTLSTPVATFYLNRPGSWSVQIVPDAGLTAGDPGGAGNYDLTIEEVSSPVEQITLAIDRRKPMRGMLRVSATVNQSVLEDGRTTAVRFWVSGVGFVSTQPLSGLIVFYLPVPAQTDGVRIRAELMEGAQPSARATAGVWTAFSVMREPQFPIMNYVAAFPPKDGYAYKILSN